MVNITETVNNFLDSNFVIRTCLMQNIISLRALSRKIIAQKNLSEKNMDAVLSAIRRYKRDHKLKNKKTENNPFKGVNIRTKDNVIDLYLPKNKNIQEKISRLIQKIDYEKGETLRTIQAEEGIRIILDEKNIKLIDETFTKKEILSLNKGLSEVILQFFPEAVETKGVISTVSSSLNAADINIREIMSSAPELIIIVANRDLVPALTIMNNLKEI